MSEFNLVMPKMGESVQEATITKWLVKPGDSVSEDDPLVEIATDKVDTEIPSPVAGKIGRILFNEGSVVPVGEIIALIILHGEAQQAGSTSTTTEAHDEIRSTGAAESSQAKVAVSSEQLYLRKGSKGRFYSPLVRSIAKHENISRAELDAINGTGLNGRVTKQDIIEYLRQKKGTGAPSHPVTEAKPATPSGPPQQAQKKFQEGDEIVEMDRLRKLIAEHMVMSKHTSPHVTNFIEADVTNLVKWRERMKDEFMTKEKQKLTFMPAFTEAAALALKEFPGVNASVDGTKIIFRRNINIGIAVALPTGNLIVPVLKNADQRNLRGLALEINRLSDSARRNKLSPDDIQGGTFTITNFGTFGNLSGTPIINQPEAAILATGAIVKKPAVVETASGDAIAIRHLIVLSLTYDHRIIDGALGGKFLKKVADILANFDDSRII
jgi:2-oxoglutarate dehydrogenase E2 component (dihydrolipoamide succinyltransferase)